MKDYLGYSRYSAFLGSRFGSQALAAILYQTSLGDFVYSTDASGNAILDNQGSLGSANDGLLYSGRGIELGATNDVDIPIHHTLGSDLIINGTFDTDTDWLKGGTATISGGTANLLATSDYVRTQTVPTDGSTVKITYTIVSSNDLELNTTGSGTAFGSTVLASTIGTHTIELTATVGFSRLYFNSNGFIGSIDNVSMEVITNPNSYLTYYDFTDGLVTLGNSVDGGSSDNLELISDNGFNDAGSWDYGATMSVSGGVVTFTNSLGNNAIRDITLNKPIVSGKTYLITFDIVSITSGSIIIRLYTGTTSVGDSQVFTTTGTKTAIIKATGNGNGIGITAVTTTNATFDNMYAKEILPISTKYTLNTKTVNNVITHTTPWSASDWTKINNNPNLIGKLALETTGATKTISELDMVMDAGASADSYYMCSEKSGAYLVDARAGYGADQKYAAFGGVYTPSSGAGVSTFTRIDEQNFDMAVTTSDAGSTTFPRIREDSLSPLGSGNLIKTTFRTGAISGICAVYGIFTENNIVAPVNTITLSPNTSYTFMSLAGTSALNAFYFNGTNTFSVEIRDWQVQEVINSSEISNYASTGETIRTNADLQQKGIQTTAFVTDGAGVPTAYSDNLLQFNGDGRYVDTGWIPDASSDWTIEAVFDHSTQLSLSGCFGGTTQRIFFGSTGSDKINYSIGDTYKETLTGVNIGGRNHIIISYIGSTKTATTYINNTAITPVITNLVQPIHSVYIGNVNNLVGYEHKKPIAIFKQHNKALTATEVATAYAQAKTIYPTLP